MARNATRKPTTRRGADDRGAARRGGARRPDNRSLASSAASSRRRRGQEAPEPPIAPKKTSSGRRIATLLTGVVLFAGGVVAGSQLDAFAPSEALAALTPGPSDVAPSESRGMRAVIDALKSRERALDRRERSIDAREADLRQVETELEERLAELQALRESLSVMLEESDEVREERVRQLTKMVEAMRSKQAAGVFAELDDDLAVQVLRRMNKAKAGKTLAAMDPVRAALLSEMLTRSPVQELPEGATQ